MTTMIITPIESVQRRRETVVSGVETTSSGRGRAIPLFVPRDQLYYWTNRWQSAERAAVIELEDGLGRTFADGTSAAEWLLSDDDDED